MKKATIKKLTITGIVCLVCIIVVLICDICVVNNAKGRIYNDVESLPHQKVGLILGTSPVSTWSGRRNHNFDVTRGLHHDVKESIVRDFTKVNADVLSVSHIETKYGDLICLKPDLNGLKVDMVCGEIPSPENGSIILAFAGAFTGTEFDKGHANVAGDHVAGGVRFKGYRCKRNTGAFTWSAKSGSQFFYKDYSPALDRAAKEGGMGFAQEMMIHNGQKVPTTRPLGNKNVFRALCLDSDNHLVLYESQGIVTFGNFIEALLSQGVKEALYTDMGQGWNYCFYRVNQSDKTPRYLHSTSLPYASNFIVIKTK